MKAPTVALKKAYNTCTHRVYTHRHTQWNPSVWQKKSLWS